MIKACSQSLTHKMIALVSSISASCWQFLNTNFGSRTRLVQNKPSQNPPNQKKPQTTLPRKYLPPT